MKSLRTRLRYDVIKNLWEELRGRVWRIAWFSGGADEGISRRQQSVKGHYRKSVGILRILESLMQILFATQSISSDPLPAGDT